MFCANGVFPPSGGNGQQTKSRAFKFPKQVFFLVLSYLYKKKSMHAKHFLIFSLDTKLVTLAKVSRGSNHTQHRSIRVNTGGMRDNDVFENSIAA